MSGSLTYFIFNKASDYQRGHCQNLILGDRHMTLAIPSSGDGNKGIFISPLLDSGEQDFLWHRMVIDGQNLGNVRYHIYASNQRKIWYKESWHDLETVIKDKWLSSKEKLVLFKTMEQLYVEGAADMLLYKVKGRYLFLYLELLDGDDGTPDIHSFKIYMPKKSWISYLPEIYQENEQSDFLERYLAVFSSIYEDMTKSIEDIPRYLDPDSVPQEFLCWLAQWQSIQSAFLWSDEKLRLLMKRAPELYKIRGTRESIVALVKLYTGDTPLIVEGYEIHKYQNQPAVYEQLKRFYSDNPYIVTVLVKDHLLKKRQDYIILCKILELVRPAHIELKVVLLTQQMYTNQHVLLGINSQFGRIQELRLDGTGAIPFVKLGRGPDRADKDQGGKDR